MVKFAARTERKFMPPHFIRIRRSLIPFLFFTSILLFSSSISILAAPQRKSDSNGVQSKSLPSLTNEHLLDEIERRAIRFFNDKSDAVTGLTNDRARNVGKEDDYSVASTASTGYELASLPIAVERHWVTREAAYSRAARTLNYIAHKLPQEHGWYYHFIDKHTGERVWESEVSSIDTAILVTGALVCGQYWSGTEIDKLAGEIYDRMDWQWMLTNGGTVSEKKLLSHGWKPETGFLPYNWDRYSESMMLYLLGLGASRNPLPTGCWSAWERNRYEYKGHLSLAGGPIFMHQASHIYYDFRNQRDSLGWDYQVSSIEAIRIQQIFCKDRTTLRKTYAQGLWGLNASDGPDGYRAYGIPNDEDGTISPTGVAASILFEPKSSHATIQNIYTHYGDRIWGRYGFGNALNLDRNWFDEDVIGIDLGMALLAIEDYRSGLPWRLLKSRDSTKRAWKAAGFHLTKESQPRHQHQDRN